MEELYKGRLKVKTEIVNLKYKNLYMKLHAKYILSLFVLIINTSSGFGEIASPDDAPGLRPAMIPQADIICIARFVKTENAFYSTKSDLTNAIAGERKGTWLIANLDVEQFIKGDGEKHLTLYNWISENHISGLDMSFPWSERMLFFLKKDNQHPGCYVLLNPSNSFLLLPSDSDITDIGKQTPTEAIQKLIKIVFASLSSLNISDSDNKRVAPLITDASRRAHYLESLRKATLQNAIATTLKFQFNDPVIITDLEKVSNVPDTNIRMQALSAVLALGANQSYTYIVKKIEEKTSPAERNGIPAALLKIVATAVEKQNVDMLGAFLTSDIPTVKIQASIGLRNLQPSLKTLLIFTNELNNETDREGQSLAMLALFEYAHKFDLTTPRYPSPAEFSQDPNHFVTQWRSWLASNRDILVAQIANNQNQ